MYRMKKIAVKMSNVVKKMGDHMPERFLWHYIFLSAVLAIVSLHCGAAIQAILFLSFGYVRHCNFFLKITTKKYKNLFFFVTEQFR